MAKVTLNIYDINTSLFPIENIFFDHQEEIIQKIKAFEEYRQKELSDDQMVHIHFSIYSRQKYDPTVMIENDNGDFYYLVPYRDHPVYYNNKIHSAYIKNKITIVNYLTIGDQSVYVSIPYGMLRECYYHNIFFYIPQHRETRISQFQQKQILTLVLIWYTQFIFWKQPIPIELQSSNNLLDKNRFFDLPPEVLFILLDYILPNFEKKKIN